MHLRLEKDTELALVVAHGEDAGGILLRFADLLAGLSINVNDSVGRVMGTQAVLSFLVEGSPGAMTLLKKRAPVELAPLVVHVCSTVDFRLPPGQKPFVWCLQIEIDDQPGVMSEVLRLLRVEHVVILSQRSRRIRSEFDAGRFRTSLTFEIAVAERFNENEFKQQLATLAESRAVLQVGLTML
jgi:glycine cleavage system regulatory protein